MLSGLGMLAAIGTFVYMGMFFLGIISPKLVKRESRKEVMKISIGGFFVCFILATVFIGIDSDNEKEQIAIDTTRQAKVQKYNDSIKVMVDEGKILLEKESWAAAISVFEGVPTEYAGYPSVDSLIAISLVGEFLDSLVDYISNTGWLAVPDMIQAFVENNPGVNEKVPDMHVVAIKGRELLNTANQYIEGTRILEKARSEFEIGKYEWAITRASKLDQNHPLFSEAQAFINQVKLEVDNKEKAKKAKQAKAVAEKKRKALATQLNPEQQKNAVRKFEIELRGIGSNADELNDAVLQLFAFAGDGKIGIVEFRIKLGEARDAFENAEYQIGLIKIPNKLPNKLRNLLKASRDNISFAQYRRSKAMVYFLKYVNGEKEKDIKEGQSELSVAQGHIIQGSAELVEALMFVGLDPQ